jgi:hypothetical protein
MMIILFIDENKKKNGTLDELNDHFIFKYSILKILKNLNRKQELKISAVISNLIDIFYNHA